MSRGGPKGNAHRGAKPTGQPDNIERIATNVRIDGLDTVHRRGDGDAISTACGDCVPFRRYILTTAPLTCKRSGCAVRP